MKPKKLINVLFLFTLLSSVSKTSYSQLLQSQWAIGHGGFKDDEPTTLNYDKNNNLYVGGTFSSDTIQFGNNYFYNPWLMAQNKLWMTKYDGQGNILWAFSAGNDATSFINAKVKVDNNNDVVLIANFLGDSIVIGNRTIYNDIINVQSCLIIKFNSTGSITWVKAIQGQSALFINDLAIDTKNNILLGGEIHGPYYVESDTVFSSFGPSISKLNSNGKLLWGKSFIADNQSGEITAISSDKEDNIIVCSSFTSVYIYTTKDSLFTNEIGYNRCIVKLDSMGIVTWNKLIESPQQVYSHKNLIEIDSNNSIYLAGHSTGPFIKASGITINNSVQGFADIYLLKYTPSGNLQFGKMYGGNSNENVNGMTINKNKNEIYLGGLFSSTNLIFNNDTLHNNGFDDYLILALDTLGNCITTSTNPNILNPFNNIKSISSSSSGKIGICGTFLNPAVDFFGNNSATHHSSNFNTDIFVAQFYEAPLIVLNSNDMPFAKTFPNPFTNYFYVSNIDLLAELKIYDIYGKILKNEFHLQSNKVDLTEFPSGSYFITIKTINNKFYKTKIIKR